MSSKLQSSAQSSGRVKALLLAATLSLFSFILYSPSLSGGFVYDDVAILQYDSYPHEPRNILDIFTLRILSRDMMDWNRPLTVLSTMLDSLLWGKNPTGYHLSNNGMHSIVVALVFLLILDVLRRAWPADRDKSMFAAFVGALLFAVHPINCEAVVPVTFREDVMVCGFILGAILTTRLFASDRKKDQWAGVAAVLLLQVLAVGTKESGLLTPVVLATYWLVFRRTESRTPWLYAVVGGVAIALTFTTLSVALRFKGVSVVYPADRTYLGGSFTKMLLIAPSMWFYEIKHVLLPIGLHPAYSTYDLRYSPYLIAIPALVTLAIGGILLARRSRVALFALAFSCVMFAPTSNLVPLYQSLADRFMYVPMVGVSTLAALLFSSLFRRAATLRMRLILVSVVGVLCTVLSVATYGKIGMWHDQISLWSYVLSRDPTSTEALTNLGFAYYEKGDLAKATRAFDLGTGSSNGKDPMALAGLALCAFKMGDYDIAGRAFRGACAIDPMYTSPTQLISSLRWSKEDAAVLDQIRGLQ